MWDFIQVILSLGTFINFISEIGIVIANLEITVSVGDKVCDSTVTVLMSFSFSFCFPGPEYNSFWGGIPIILVSVRRRVPASDVEVEEGCIISQGSWLC